MFIKEKASKSKGKIDNFANLEKVVIEHKLDDEEMICDKCKSPLDVIGKKTKEVLKFVPAKLYIEEHITYSYDCKSCETTSGETNIITTKGYEGVLFKSMASNELSVHVVTMKYQHAMSLYRLESYFKMLEANLSRQTLSNWIMGIADIIIPLYEFMKTELLKINYVQANETTLQIIENNSKESKSKKYMWLYKTGASEKPIVLYDYQKTKSSSCPKEFSKYKKALLFGAYQKKIP